MGAKPHKKASRARETRHNGKTGTKKSDAFSLVSSEPGEALLPGLVFCVKEAREYMLTGRLLDREG